MEIILIVVAILNIILFFKIWEMTNNVKRIMSFYMHKNGIKTKLDGTSAVYKDKDHNDIEMM